MENQDNSGKQNAKFLGDFKEEKPKSADVETGQSLMDSLNKLGELIDRKKLTVKADVLPSHNSAPPSPAYFIATEDGIADIESPPSDN